MIDFARFTHLSFDCYGTLIDWETGILEAFRPILAAHDIAAGEVELLQLYAKLEAAEEAGPYKSYRAVLRAVMATIGKALGFVASDADCNAFSSSVTSWPPFGDSVEALRRLRKRFKLVAVSNIDDDLIEKSAKLLGDPFDEVITAQQVGSYKPSRDVFRQALDRLAVPKDKLLHVAQSLYHDHVPAKELGLTTVWVNRASRCPGVGVAPPADASPDDEVPDMLCLVLKAGL